MKEELLKMLKESPEMLKELLQESPELKNIIKQVIKPAKDKSLLSKLNKWGIEKEEIPGELAIHIDTVEKFLSWLDQIIRAKTNNTKALHISIRPVNHKEN